MKCALAVDGGGSKTDAVIIDETGQVLGWGRGGPVHHYYSTPDEVQASYRQALEQALEGVQAESICLSGIPRHQQFSDLIARHGEISGYARADEVSTAFASVQEEWGLVVLAGTGSFVFGLTPDGTARHYGGLGPVLGDYGSAYEVGLRGLRAAFASAWAPRRATTLATAVPGVFDLPDLRAVFERTYGPGLSRRDTASIARVVDEQAELGDRVAAQCLREAADDLADMALDIIDGLGMGELSFPMIAVGSVAQKSRLWWARMCQRVGDMVPGVRPIIPQVRPVIGAALLGLKHLEVPWTPQLLARIRETQQPFLRQVEERSA